MSIFTTPVFIINRFQSSSDKIYTVGTSELIILKSELSIETMLCKIFESRMSSQI